MKKRALAALLAMITLLNLGLGSVSVSALAEDLPALPTESVVATEEPTDLPTNAPAEELPEVPEEADPGLLPEAPSDKPEEVPEPSTTDTPTEAPDDGEAAPSDESTGPVIGPTEAPDLGIPEEDLADFDVEALMTSLMASTECQHQLDVRENTVMEGCVSLGAEEHEERYLLKSRELYCTVCTEVLQTVELNQHLTKVSKHFWNNFDTGTQSNLFECRMCGDTKTVSFPCEHRQLNYGEAGYFYCPLCNKRAMVNSGDGCTHEQYSVVPDGSTRIEYRQFNEVSHLKHTWLYEYNDQIPRLKRCAYCSSCGKQLSFYSGESAPRVGESDALLIRTQSTELEAHSFADGVCTACGAEQASEETPIIDLVELSDTEIDPGTIVTVKVTGNEALAGVKLKITAPDGSVLEERTVDGLAFEITCFHASVAAGSYTLTFTAIGKDGAAGNIMTETIVVKNSFTEHEHVWGMEFEQNGLYYHTCIICGVTEAFNKYEGGEAEPARLTIHFPTEGMIVPVGDDLLVGWNAVASVHHYTISARYTNPYEEEPFLRRTNVGTDVAYIINGSLINKYDAVFHIWVGAYKAAEETKENLMCACTVEGIRTTVTKAKLLDVKVQPIPNNGTIFENREGLTITATVTANQQTGIVEMYVGKKYVFSESYTEKDGYREFVLQNKLGGNSQGYAGQYSIRINALKGMYQPVDDEYDAGTITVDHVWPEMNYNDGKTHPHKVVYKCTVCGNVRTESFMDHYKASCEECQQLSTMDGGKLSNATIDDGSGFLSNKYINFGKNVRVQRGYIRFVSQVPGYTGTEQKKPATFYAEQWKYGEYDRSTEAIRLCSYAVLSMQLSYLGIDCLPGEMFYILGGSDFNRQTIIDHLTRDGVNISSRRCGLSDNSLALSDLRKMLDNYEKDTCYSPIFLFMEYGSDWQYTHAVLIIGYDNGKYYIANPETQTGMGSFEIEERDGIMYIKNATTNKYNGRRVSTISQIRLN